MYKKKLLSYLIGVQLSLGSAPLAMAANLSLDELQKVLAAQNEANYSEVIKNLPEDDQIGLLEVFMESNTLECLELWIEGVCAWLIIQVTPFGVDVDATGTIEISHYNPDFIVTSFPRIGKSPLREANLLYTPIQREISKPILKLMSGRDVPAAYDDNDQYAGTMSSSSAENSTITMYSEAEVIGHPGNLITLIAKGVGADGMLGDIASLVSDSTEMLQESASEIGTLAQDVTNQLVEKEDVVPGGLSTGGWGSDGLGDSSTWDTEFSPVALALSQMLGLSIEGFEAIGDMANVMASTETALAVYETSSEHFETINDASITAAELSDIPSELSGLAETAITDNVDELTDNVLDIFNASDLDFDEIGVDAHDYYDNIFPSFSIVEQADLLNVDLPELDQMLSEIEANLELIDEAMDVLDSVGIEGASMETIPSFCPNDADVFMPYFLSGLDVLAWRYQLPEMAFPQSFAFPIPNSKYFVGKFGMEPLSVGGISVPDWSTWGNIYPRSGWVAQPDEVKNRSVAAFRAAHVVTRDSQAHLYNTVSRYKDSGLRIQHPGELDPHDKATGAWQMLYPKKASECTLLQNSEADGGIFTARDVDLTSDSGSYVYNVWRKYTCCKKPKRAGLVKFIGKVEFRVQII